MRVFLTVAMALLLGLAASDAQEKKLLYTKGWGSLSGKVTLDGKNPAVVELTNVMKKHVDAACCLDPKAKAIEKVDSTWIVDPETKAVANVVVWVMPPDGTYFPIHGKYKKRTDHVEIDQPHCAYLPRVSAYNPAYFDGAKMVKTGQKLVVKNSAVVTHNVMGIVHTKYNEGFNFNMPSGDKKDLTNLLNPQPLPVGLQCNTHGWMHAKVYVFDHPYYALTKEDGSYSISIVPAGAEIRFVAHHEGIGWVFTKEGEGKNGRPVTLKEGKNTIDFEVKAP